VAVVAAAVVAGMADEAAVADAADAPQDATGTDASMADTAIPGGTVMVHSSSRTTKSILR
jgi:hypothetical protein